MAETQEDKILNITVNYQDAINGIVKYKDAIERLKAAEKELKEQKKEGKITEEEYNVQITATEEQIKDYKDSVRVLSKEIQNNLKTQKEQEGSLKQLRAELSNATKAYDEMSREERESSKGKELKQHINDITKELKGCEEATQRFYRNVGNYEGAINNAIFGNSKFGQSLQAISEMSGGGKGLSGILDGLTNKTKAFSATVIQMCSNPYFLALAGVAGAGMAFKWFFDYNKGLLESTRLTREFLGLSGEGLTAIRSEIQATADTYGKDFKETLEAVDTLTSQYGITAKKSLEVINEGFASGADLNGDMISKIQQYAPAFHDAGIGASQLVAILQQTRSGIFSDKGLDLISMASKRIREMSTSTAASLDAIGISSKQVQKDLEDGSKNTFDIIQEVSAKLKTLPGDSQEVGEVLKDVFGKQGAAGGLEMIKSLDGMSTSLEEVKKQTGEWGENMEKQRDATAELNKTMSALFAVSDEGFEGMIASTKLMGTKIITQLLKGIIKAINYFVDLYNESAIVRAGVVAIGNQFKMLWNVVKLVVNLIIDSFKGMGRTLKGVLDILQGIITFDLSKAQQGFSELVSGYVKTVKEGWNDMKEAGKGMAQNVIDGYNAVMGKAKLAHIEIPKADESDTNGGTNGGSGSSGKVTKPTVKNGKSAKTTKNNTQAEEAKKEQEEIRKAEDLLSQIVVQNLEERRKEIERQYDRQIEDLQKRLATEKNLTVKAKQAINVQIQTLEQIKAKKITELETQFRDDDIKREQTYIEMRLEMVKKGSDEEYQLKMSKIENERQLAIDEANQAIVSEEEKQRNIMLINQKYNKAIEDADKEHQNTLIQQQTEAIKKRYEEKILQNDVDTQGTDEITQLQLQMQEKQELLENAQQLEGETIEAFNMRKLQMEQDFQNSKKALSDKEIEMEKAKASAISGCIGGVQQVAEAFSENSKSLAKVSKVLSLAEIAINTGSALAAGIKQAQSVPFPANIAAIATTVTTILANVATAIKTVKSAKFAVGGDVQGPGTGTSDSINAKLSNGESVLTAQATSMFAPALSAFNQIGGGVPIYGQNQQSQIGEEFLANAVARGMQMAPRPVVSVEEISDVMNRVEAIEKLGTIG